MRSHQIKNYRSVLEVLKEPGCPICNYLKNLQAKYLQREADGVIAPMCNVHTWGTAAVCPADSAAQVFLTLLKQQDGQSGTKRPHCWICERLQIEQIRCFEEMTSIENEPTVMGWLQFPGILCVPHGKKLRIKAGDSLRALIDQNLQERNTALQKALHNFMNPRKGKEEHGGVLGRVAEYLISQRGITF